MTIRNLEIFTKVAELGSMSAAAKVLYITQPSVSLAISDIEKEYDIRLFDRVGNTLCLTPTGQQLMNYATNIIHQYKDMELFLQDESHNAGIRVGATATIGYYIIAPIIEQLEHEIPGMRCEVTVASTGIIEEKLIKSELDIGFVEGDITSNALVVKPVLEDELTVLCSCQHRFYGKRSVFLHELEGESFILNHITYQPQWDCYSFEAIKEAVLHNLGITVMSPKVAKRELLSGELWACNIEDVSLKRTFDLVCRKGKFFNETLSRFVEICENKRHF